MSVSRPGRPSVPSGMRVLGHPEARRCPWALAEGQGPRTPRPAQPSGAGLEGQTTLFLTGVL